MIFFVVVFGRNLLPYIHLQLVFIVIYDHEYIIRSNPLLLHLKSVPNGESTKCVCEDGSEPLQNGACKVFNGTCGEKFFRCDNDNCVPKTMICDAQNDCGDNSDEVCFLVIQVNMFYKILFLSLFLYTQYYL